MINDYQPYFKNNGLIPIDYQNKPLNRQSWGHFLAMVVKIVLFMFIIYILLEVIIGYSKRLQAYNAHVCGVYGYQPNCTTKLELTGGDIK